MKIATWNLMRPTEGTLSRNLFFHKILEKCDADILVLTETNSVIDPGKRYFSRSTKKLPKKIEDFTYSKGENRASIFSKFPFGRNLKTYDEYTSVCSEVLTPYGPLILYATIIGVTGGKNERFVLDFESQKADISDLKGHLCIAGDFNISFSGYAYPGLNKISEANQSFESLNIQILTRDLPGSPDHIAISRSFIKNRPFQFSALPTHKKQSDHNLVLVDLPC